MGAPRPLNLAVPSRGAHHVLFSSSHRQSRRAHVPARCWSERGGSLLKRRSDLRPLHGPRLPRGRAPGAPHCEFAKSARRECPLPRHRRKAPLRTAGRRCPEAFRAPSRETFVLWRLPSQVASTFLPARAVQAGPDRPSNVEPSHLPCSRLSRPLCGRRKGCRTKKPRKILNILSCERLGRDRACTTRQVIQQQKETSP